MKNIESELGVIRGLDKKISASQKILGEETSPKLKAIDELQKTREEKIKALQKGIEEGKFTTGDIIKDFTIVYIGVSENAENQFRDLENHLAQHKGEFVLLKRIKSVAHGWVDFELNPQLHPELYHWEKQVEIGIISNKTPLTMDIKQGKVIIAPKKHCRFTTRWDENPFLSEHPLSISWHEFGMFGQSVESFYSSPLFSSTVEQVNSKGEKDLIREILIGDKEVIKYLNNHSIPEFYILIAKQLGRELKEIPLEAEKVFLERKTNVFMNLQELDKKVRKLQSQFEEIKKIKAPKIGDSIHFRDIDENTERDFEDLKIIKSIPINKEREDILRQIKSQLEEAFDLEMHKEPWVITEEPEPGKKVEINVPQLIRGYCEFYDFVDLRERLTKDTFKT